MQHSTSVWDSPPDHLTRLGNIAGEEESGKGELLTDEPPKHLGSIKQQRYESTSVFSLSLSHTLLLYIHSLVWFTMLETVVTCHGLHFGQRLDLQENILPGP